MNPPVSAEHEYEIWGRNVGRATRDLIEMLQQADTIHRVAFDRMKSGLLVFQGNQRYTAMSVSELGYESLEELADSINYRIWHNHLQEQQND